MKKSEQRKAIAHAKDLAENVFDSCYNSPESFYIENFDIHGRDIAEEFVESIMETPIHKAAILATMEAEMILAILKNPDAFKSTDDVFSYTSDDMDFQDVILQYIDDRHVEAFPFEVDLFAIGNVLTTNNANMLRVQTTNDYQVCFKDLLNGDLCVLDKSEHKYELANPKTILKTVLVEVVRDYLEPTDITKEEAAKEIIEDMSDYFDKFLD